MKHIFFALLMAVLPIMGFAQGMLYVYAGTNGYAAAASRSDLSVYNLDPYGLFGREHPDFARWQIETGFPVPRIVPAVVDRDSGAVVEVRNGDVDTALSRLSVVASNHPAGQRRARIDGNRNGAAFVTMTNNMSQFVASYEDYTNLVATSSFTSNQLKVIFNKQAKAMDALYDVLKKVVPVLRSSVEDQR